MAEKKRTEKPQQQSKNWYKDRYESVLTQRNFLGIIAFSSLILALVAGAVVLMLVQSKTVVPFLIQVDEKTGLTQVVNQESKKEITADEAVRKYFIATFLRSMEGYDSSDIRINTNIVRLMAQREIYKAYWRDKVDPQNPESLYATLSAGKIRQVRIKSMTFPDFKNPNKVFVQFNLIERGVNKTSNETERPFVANMEFRFRDLNLGMEDLLVNPLGFQVINYKVDEELQ